MLCLTQLLLVLLYHLYWCQCCYSYRPQAARAAVVGQREGDTTAAASVQQLQRLSRVKVAIHPDVVPKGNTDWRRCLSAGGAWILTASGAGEVSVRYAL
jgi:hypothetical protein